MIATNDGALVKSRSREAISRNKFRKDYNKFNNKRQVITPKKARRVKI